ncbi:MAG: PHP domain-containing protein [Vicinamibacterales bacterium]
MIDLHLHTTASDGWLTPAALVARAAAAGLTRISVTDHDTVASIAAATALGAEAGLAVVPGIEITAVHARRDVHVLGYFFDPDDRGLLAFLERQRARRVERVREIGARLARLGVPVDVDGVLLPAAERPGVSVGRPLIARALVGAGHARSVQDAFDRYLDDTQPAFVPRTGHTPAEVVQVIHDAGGIASLAHPAVTARDEIIEPLAAAGLDAIEVYHSDHDAEAVATYAALATRLGLAVSGGSDFHGEPETPPVAPAPAAAPRRGRRGTRSTLGHVSLPPECYADLERLAAGRRRT